MRTNSIFDLSLLSLENRCRKTGKLLSEQTGLKFIMT